MLDTTLLDRLVGIIYKKSFTEEVGVKQKARRNKQQRKAKRRSDRGGKSKNCGGVVVVVLIVIQFRFDSCRGPPKGRG